MIKVTKQERKAGPTLKSRLRATSERLSGMTLLDYASRSNTHAEIAELEEELLPGLKQFAMIEECDEDEGQPEQRCPAQSAEEILWQEEGRAPDNKKVVIENRDLRRDQPVFQIRQLSKSKRHHPAHAQHSNERGGREQSSPLRMSFYSHHYQKLKQERRTHMNIFAKKIQVYRPKAKQNQQKRF